MQVTATLSEGLKREFRVVVPVTDLAERAGKRLDDLKGRVNINGFRPGKVPTAHLKKLYGKAVLAETIEALVGETNQKIVTDNNFKLAMEPAVKLPEAENEAQAVFEGTADLDYTVSFEVLPTIQLADFKGIKVEKPVVEPAEADVAAMLETMAKQNRPFEPKTKGKAETGDRVTVSFVGTIDGEKFEGGTADDIQVEIGSNSFIPGFEEQLVGVKTGEDKVLKVKFPSNYAAPNLAGKDAEFAVNVKSMEKPGERAIDDEFAKMVGFEDLEKLKAAVSDRLKSEYSEAARRKVKRILLDALDEKHAFELPPTLVEQEFEGVWRQVSQDLESRGKTFADEDTTEEKARDEYRKIAERRVRLGLVLAEIGDKAQIKVNDEEVTRAVVERARQFPGQEQQVWDYYRKTPEALASLRAPIFEEKVVDYILELADVTEKVVSKDELFKDNEAEEAA
ncbi:trigger factor [Phreatobacter aquaticus]|uniref:Trigger factor n=1 Tax=Phreatobacter aquaticus TaxID=2570229 RepID=A0A4D7QRZ3_9HYPH|nr:trigger factor [Phreatobacter aquaticus]QCK87697.1 trigger factor [Phreatobacter aquaticus]